MLTPLPHLRVSQSVPAMQCGPCSDKSDAATRHATAALTNSRAIDTITCVAFPIYVAALSHAVGSTAHLEHTETLGLGQANWDKLLGQAAGTS